ncbi:MAG: addiction module protein [Gemmataceae bacterium]
MSPTMEELGIDRLSREDRLLLAHEILESVVDEEPGSTLTPEKRAELRRRMQDHLENPDDVVPWEEVKAELVAKYGS